MKDSICWGGQREKRFNSVRGVSQRSGTILSQEELLKVSPRDGYLRPPAGRGSLSQSLGSLEHRATREPGLDEDFCSHPSALCNFCGLHPGWAELPSGWRVWAQKEKLSIAQLYSAPGHWAQNPTCFILNKAHRQQGGLGEVLSSCLQIGKGGSESWNDLSKDRSGEPEETQTV